MGIGVLGSRMAERITMKTCPCGKEGINQLIEYQFAKPRDPSPRRTEFEEWFCDSCAETRRIGMDVHGVWMGRFHTIKDSNEVEWVSKKFKQKWEWPKGLQ